MRCENAKIHSKSFVGHEQICIFRYNVPINCMEIPLVPFLPHFPAIFFLLYGDQFLKILFLPHS